MENNWPHIILFDGVCNLCNGAVQFIIKHDKKDKFKFAPLQSEFGQNQLVKYQLNRTSMDTFVYLSKGKAYTKSTAALKIAKELRKGWQLFYGFIIIPKFIRDWFYNRIAKNRYKLFGRKESCMLPTPELKEKFL